MFTAVAVPSLIFFFAAMFIPESPRWLVKIGANQRARGTLARIGGEKYSDEAIAEIQGTLNAPGRSVAAWHELRTPYILKRSEEHTSELQSLTNLVCRLL